MEPLDLVILGGEWGTGRRAGWISSFVLGCRSRATGEFLKIGKVGTGFKEKAEMGVSFEELTARMKKDVISADGRDIIVKPKIVIEVGYEEIQRSPKYGSGYALRFPRLLRLRDDKPLNEVDNLRRVERLYNAQRHR
jgi:DNA ligase-1